MCDRLVCLHVAGVHLPNLTSKRRKYLYINTEYAGCLAPFLEEHVQFDKGLTSAICSCMVVLVSRVGEIFHFSVTRTYFKKCWKNKFESLLPVMCALS